MVLLLLDVIKLGFGAIGVGADLNLSPGAVKFVALLLDIIDLSLGVLAVGVDCDADLALDTFGRFLDLGLEFLGEALGVRLDDNVSGGNALIGSLPAS